MSLQIAILKVLSCHRDGRAEVATMKSDLAILTTSGRDWSERIKRMASQAPSLDIFQQGYVRCDRHFWELTREGRSFLASIDDAGALRAAV